MREQRHPIRSIWDIPQLKNLPKIDSFLEVRKFSDLKRAEVTRLSILLLEQGGVHEAHERRLD